MLVLTPRSTRDRSIARKLADTSFDGELDSRAIEVSHAACKCGFRDPWISQRRCIFWLLLKNENPFTHKCVSCVALGALTRAKDTVGGALVGPLTSVARVEETYMPIWKFCQFGNVFS